MTRMRLRGGASVSMRVAIGTSKASASAERVAIVGDFALRSMSEIIDERLGLTLRALAARSGVSS